jgi:transcription-repair coupling factor (superfamily II helicase)
LHLSISGRLPVEWIPEPEVRVALYARLARIEESSALDALEEELEDRFGPLPREAEALVALVRVGCLARAANLARIDAGPGGIALTPRAGGFAGDPDALGLVVKNDRLILPEKIENEVRRLDRVRTLLEAIL